MLERRFFNICLLLCVVLAFTGCGAEKPVEKEAATFEIEEEYKRGPIIFQLKVSKKEVTIAEHLNLNIDVYLQEDYEIQLPEFGEKLEQFGIGDYSAPPPKLVENSQIHYQKSYKLIPFLSGEYHIPSMKVLFWKKQQKEGEDKKHEVESEELTIQVNSLLPEDMADLTIKEIVPPMSMPNPVSPWLYGILLFVLLVLGGGYYIWRKQQQKPQVEFKRPAHEIAYDALEQLIKEDLIEKKEIKTFYVRLSNILRYYIEQRFALRAPESTTEEFLNHLRHTDVLNNTLKGLLKNFLQHCDMVKFAKHQPDNEEIQQTFDHCKNFIIETQAQTSTGETVDAV